MKLDKDGQTLLFPPSVAGWEGGPAWVNTATMIERIRFAGLFSPKDKRQNYCHRSCGNRARNRGRPKRAGADRSAKRWPTAINR